jgi:predicted enzyme related to lactoylglutathione lyase
MARPPEMKGVPLQWSTYIAVEALDETLARAAELGGTVVHGPMDSPFGPFAGILDPGGATFTAIQLTG